MTSSETEPDQVNPFEQRNFIFTACQPRSQSLCKKEFIAARPDLLPSFSRPGFLTWKTTTALPDRFDLPLTYTRTFGWSVDQFKDAPMDQVASRVRELANHAGPRSGLHVWNRSWSSDPGPANQKPDSETLAMAHLLKQELPDVPINQVASPDQLIVDVVRIDDGHWFFGWHTAGTIPQRWPGGIPPLKIPGKTISRAYLKTSEALLWSGISMSKGVLCAEIGSAPGGSCQRLLETGARVIAIDPADLDESIAKHERINHLKMRGHEVSHKSLANVAWLFVDSNVAPQQTLDTVEALTTGKQTRFQGLFLTLKLSEAGMIEEIGAWLDRVRSWGYQFVKTRHLAYGRQEICLVAMKRKATRRFQR